MSEFNVVESKFKITLSIVNLPLLISSKNGVANKRQKNEKKSKKSKYLECFHK